MPEGGVFINQIQTEMGVLKLICFIVCKWFKGTLKGAPDYSVGECRLCSWLKLV